VPAGTDNQAFCYDEQDRLTWASAASGTIPCGGTNTAGTLTAASYTQSFAYDNLNRLTSGPLGSYTYGAAHLHGATAIGGQWTGSYDASGNLTCRAPSSSTTCSGTQTGAQLSYDNEGRLTAWQNAPSSPTSTDNFLYDGEGHRVEQQVTASGTTTTTVYVGGLETITTTGSSTTTTAYYSAGGSPLALAVNGTISYLAGDGPGSMTEALSATGTVQATQLYAPYGTSRYSSGTMPTDYGYTGQRADATTGLDYYNARYFDPVVGQFASADTWLVGLNRYSYVGGNPESLVDPSGHLPQDPGPWYFWWTLARLWTNFVTGFGVTPSDVMEISTSSDQAIVSESLPGVDPRGPGELIQDAVIGFRNMSQGDTTIPGLGTAPASDTEGAPPPPTTRGPDDDGPRGGPPGGRLRGRSPSNRGGPVRKPQIAPQPPRRVFRNQARLIALNDGPALTLYTGVTARLLRANGYNDYGQEMLPYLALLSAASTIPSLLPQTVSGSGPSTEIPEQIPEDGIPEGMPPFEFPDLFAA
jgi:RHS repeat-associated protein